MDTAFTPLASAFGGALIGLSAVLLMAGNGRIAGISGIAGRLLALDLGGRTERPGLFFVVGLLLAAPIWWLVAGDWPAQTVQADPLLMAGAGVIVGVGVTLGSGCTSGHGVCGLSRFSGRSLAATLTFMAVAAATVFVTRHVLGG